MFPSSIIIHLIRLGVVGEDVVEASRAILVNARRDHPPLGIDVVDPAVGGGGLLRLEEARQAGLLPDGAVVVGDGGVPPHTVGTVAEADPVAAAREALGAVHRVVGDRDGLRADEGHHAHGGVVIDAYVTHLFF